MEITKLYNGEVELIFNPEKHVYTVDGKIVDGVTSVLNVLNQEKLYDWKRKMAIDRIRQKLVPGSKFTQEDLNQLFVDAEKTPDKIKIESADIGTELHNWIEEYIKTGKKPKAPKNKYVKGGANSFLKWVSENNIQFLESERPIFSREHFYSGTLDFTANLNGKLVIGDIKTSSFIIPKHLFQTAAYQQAYQEETGNNVKGRIIIRLGYNHWKKTPEMETRYSEDFIDDFEAFRSCLVLSRRLRNMGQK